MAHCGDVGAEGAGAEVGECRGRRLAGERADARDDEGRLGFLASGLADRREAHHGRDRRGDLAHRLGLRYVEALWRPAYFHDGLLTKTMAESIIDSIIEIRNESMARTVGDKNLSLREQRLIAKLEAQKHAYEAKVQKAKADLAAEKARSKELKARLQAP